MSAADETTLRDYFATAITPDEVDDIEADLSRSIQETLARAKAPEPPSRALTIDESIANRLAELDFKLSVNAAIRFRFADAMLKARQS